MRRGMKKTSALTVRRYLERLIGLNWYLVFFLGETFNDKIGVTDPNKILLNIVPTSCYKQAYVHDFVFESIMF